MDKGILITIEGIDGAGKSTVIESLNKEFPNAVFTSEPQEDQWLGKILRKALSDENMSDMSLFFLFLSEHAQHIEDYVNPALQENKLVVSDRFVDSRYAYQTYALDNNVNGDTLDWIRSIQENGWSTIPDQTIILDIGVDTSLERIADNKKEVFEKRDRLEAARDIYLTLANENNERYTIIDAEQTQEKVIQECINVIKKEM